MLDCVTDVLRIVGNREINTYNKDFQEEMLKITTFSEGEQFIQNYCQAKGIKIK